MNCFALQCVDMKVRKHGSSGQVDLHYITEADVVVFVKNFLRDIANAMGIPLFMASDFGIKQLAPDICVFSLGLVGGGDQEAS